MKKMNIRIGVILVAIISVLLTKTTSHVYANEITKNQMDEKAKKIILIDPGHGGIDGGAVSKNGVSEKNINLAIGLMLKKNLENLGYKAEMTRTEDKSLNLENKSVRLSKSEDLSARCELIKTTKCNAFVSIHLNKFHDNSSFGAQVWYAPNSGSSKLAHIIQQNIVADVDPKNYRKEKGAGDDYRVLRHNGEVPSVIVECGFLSNPTDEKNLQEKDYQEKIAKSIAKSLKEYLDTYTN